MGEKRYIISDASKKVDVEAHVLRYWEEQLGIEVPRNEMGHRYYTEYHIKLFQNIRDFKEQGFQLKAIKMLLPELETSDNLKLQKLFLAKDELNREAEEGELAQELAPVEENKPQATMQGNKMDQFQIIIGNIVAKALHDNNSTLGKDISEQVSDSVIKEMDYLMRLQDEKEEERYKKFDEILRNAQRGTKEIAYTAEKPTKMKKKSKFFKKYNK